MKSVAMVLLLLAFFAFVCCSAFPGQEVLGPQPGSRPSSDDMTVVKRCTQLGLNTFVKLLNELNLTKLLESYPLGNFHISCVFQIELLRFLKSTRTVMTIRKYE